MESKPGGFDVSALTTASKIMLVSGILLLVDSFLAWQKVCASDIVGGDLGDVVGDICASASAWGGNGAFAGLIMGILLIVLVIWEVVQLSNMAGNLQVGIPPTKGSAYLGFAVVVFGVLKFLLVVANEAAIGAWIGLVLLVALAYGSWMKFQEVEAAPAGGATAGDTGFSA
jgi:hypothetical protein